jgi:GTP cyclohydrolase II
MTIFSQFLAHTLFYYSFFKQALKINKVNLLTNNPEKLKAFNNSGILLNKRIPLEIESNPANASYLSIKKEYFGHLLEKL